MTKRNAQNELIKRRYFEFLKHADGKADATIKIISASIRRYETFSKHKDFKTFDRNVAIQFKEDLGDRLSLASLMTTTNHLKRFFAWLAQQNGYKRSIKFDDIAYLNLSDRDKRAASAPADLEFPSLDMVREVVSKMPHATAIEKRNRALIAFTALTMIRVSALASLKIKHLNPKTMLVSQNPREVNTKARKPIYSHILPFCDDFEDIIREWIIYLKTDLLFSPTDPLFPKTALTHDEDACYAPEGLLREHWQSTSPIRRVFKEAFEAANLPVYTPHRFRNMMEAEITAIDPSFAEYKAFSQSFGHKNVMTTITSYGKLSITEQGQRIRNDLKKRFNETHG
ncbi:MAG: tyrosine-type recombinase/integrase [Alphaproteobacteria bacterium]